LLRLTVRSLIENGKGSHMKKNEKVLLSGCATCEHETDKKICMDEKGLGSKGCPTLVSKDVLDEANREYGHPQIREFARQASRQEAECYANRH
jgi:predicted  nucleic acid-binding Zn-ribbon protein